MRYWVYQDSRILGPYSREDLLGMPGIHGSSLICEGAASGTGDADWKPLLSVPDLADALTAQGPAMGLPPALDSFGQFQQEAHAYLDNLGMGGDAAPPVQTLTGGPLWGALPDELGAGFQWDRQRTMDLEARVYELQDQLKEQVQKQDEILDKLSEKDKSLEQALAELDAKRRLLAEKESLLTKKEEETGTLLERVEKLEKMPPSAVPSPAPEAESKTLLELRARLAELEARSLRSLEERSSPEPQVPHVGPIAAAAAADMAAGGLSPETFEPKLPEAEAQETFLPGQRDDSPAIPALGALAGAGGLAAVSDLGSAAEAEASAPVPEPEAAEAPPDFAPPLEGPEALDPGASAAPPFEIPGEAEPVAGAGELEMPDVAPIEDNAALDIPPMPEIAGFEDASEGVDAAGEAPPPLDLGIPDAEPLQAVSEMPDSGEFLPPTPEEAAAEAPALEAPAADALEGTPDLGTPAMEGPEEQSQLEPPSLGVDAPGEPPPLEAAFGAPEMGDGEPQLESLGEPPPLDTPMPGTETIPTDPETGPPGIDTVPFSEQPADQAGDMAPPQTMLMGGPGTDSLSLTPPPGTQGTPSGDLMEGVLGQAPTPMPIPLSDPGQGPDSMTATPMPTMGQPDLPQNVMQGLGISSQATPVPGATPFPGSTPMPIGTETSPPQTFEEMMAGGATPLPTPAGGTVPGATPFPAPTGAPVPGATPVPVAIRTTWDSSGTTSSVKNPTHRFPIHSRSPIWRLKSLGVNAPDRTTEI